MKTVTVLLDTIEKVRDFVEKITLLEGEFDLISDRYIINAKSIMGIFSLDLSRPLKLAVHNENVLERILEDFKDFIV